MTNFIAEFMIIDYKPHNDLTNKVYRSLPTWRFHIDGVANEQGCGAGLILTSLKPKCIIIEYAIHLSFKVTNNKAEYEALLTRLCIANSLNVKKIHIYSDSQLIVK